MLIDSDFNNMINISHPNPITDIVYHSVAKSGQKTAIEFLEF